MLRKIYWQSSLGCQYRLCSNFKVKQLIQIIVFNNWKRKFSVKSLNIEKSIKKLVNENCEQISLDNENIRISDLKIQMLSKILHEQIFRNLLYKNPSPEDTKKSISHLQKHGLWGKETIYTKPIHFQLPPFKGNNLDEHFRIIGEEQSKIYKKLLSNLIHIKIPPLPKTWNFSPGWTRYDTNDKFIKVDFPECSSLVFDIEVCMSEGPHPTLACAMSDKYWYSWCSQELIGSTSQNSCITLDNLIPLHNKSNATPKVIIGHNVSFDRKGVKEEYLIEDSKIRFVDTMSMHIAVSGLVEEQRGIILKNAKADKKIRLPWMNVGSQNSLKEVLKFYCKEELVKESRDIFVKGSIDEVREQFQGLMVYCSQDVIATHKVLNKLLPLFFERFPHPVTFAGMLEMSTAYLPVSEDWMKYIFFAEKEFNELTSKLNKQLIEQTVKALKLGNEEKYKKNPWLWDLDWALPKGRVKTLKNFPNWYRKLCKKKETEDKMPKPENMSTSLRIVPKLLHLTWNGYPLHYDKEGGWGFLKAIPKHDDNDVYQTTEVKTEFPYDVLYSLCKKLEKNNINESEIHAMQPGTFIGIPNVKFYPLPHKDGEGNRVGNPLAKDFLRKLEDGTLSSAVPDVAELVLKITKTISYWKNNRDRILSQTVMWLPNNSLPLAVTKSAEFNDDVRCGAILPQVVTAGTITRRAVEKTWMTASNAYGDRIGSELKAMIKAPPGYHFVGADVDSEELWIASVLGDAYFGGQHGCTALGWMTLKGNKSTGTDMHSRTAESAGISRNNAKINRLVKLSRMHNYEVSRQDILKEISVWVGGSESYMFNCLEAIARSDKPRTPVLGARITRALEPWCVEDSFMTSRVNWVVQSSAVDFLHLMLVSMRWLISEYNINGRFSISIHDEVRYLVASGDRYRAALSLHITNLLVRSYISNRLGINDLPQSVAFFESVDIDKVLRKEPDMDCVTPSNPDGLEKGYNISKGESLSIHQTIEKTKGKLDLE